MSLAQLLPSESERQLSMESTAATIMAKFEGMWSTFLSNRGSFEPFMSLYLERWLHSYVLSQFLLIFLTDLLPCSDQLITIATTTPPKKVRITGITPDHGLLRTLPERTGWSKDSEGFIDLQPDGNSFDIMAGLIISKS
jgi:biotin--protein ligase